MITEDYVNFLKIVRASIKEKSPSLENAPVNTSHVAMAAVRKSDEGFYHHLHY